MNAKELVLVLDEFSNSKLNIGVGNSIHQMLKTEVGAPDDCVVVEYGGRKFYQVVELRDDEIILDISFIPLCAVTYNRMLLIRDAYYSIMEHVAPIFTSEQFVDKVDELSGLIMRRAITEPFFLHVVREE